MVPRETGTGFTAGGATGKLPVVPRETMGKWQGRDYGRGCGGGGEIFTARLVMDTANLTFWLIKGSDGRGA